MKFNPKYLAIAIIQLYQRTISLDHGPLRFLRPYGFCRFFPSCSEYAIQALEKYGLLRGGAKAAWRVLRCNPWNQGGYDPLK